MSADSNPPSFQHPDHTGRALVGICLDLDGTLVDSVDDLADAVNAMLADRGHAPLARELIAGFVGKGADVLVRRALARVGEIASEDSDSPACLREARAGFDRHYARFNGVHARVYPGVAEGLEALDARGLRLAIVTNKPGVFVMPLLERTGLARWFTHPDAQVLGGDALPQKKPDPAPLLEVCRRWSCRPGQVWMVGDSGNDALAAHAAGMRVWLVPYGYSEGRPVQELVDRRIADGIVGSLAELPSLIDATGR